MFMLSKIEAPENKHLRLKNKIVVNIKKKMYFQVTGDPIWSSSMECVCFFPSVLLEIHSVYDNSLSIRYLKLG